MFHVYGHTCILNVFCIYVIPNLNTKTCFTHCDMVKPGQSLRRPREAFDTGGFLINF
jgi:hypothetical protein